MLEEIISIVRRAGGIVRGAHDVERVTSEKSCSEDLVTEYDTGVQAFLRKELLALLPQPASMEAVRAAAIRAATFFFFMDLSSLKILFLHLL